MLANGHNTPQAVNHTCYRHIAPIATAAIILAPEFLHPLLVAIAAVANVAALQVNYLGKSLPSST
jgi:uncharacterized integral membrane protein